MKQLFRFLGKVLLFLLPVALVLSPLALSGELVNGQTVMQAQVQGGVSLLYGPLFTEQQYRYYKATAVQAEKPSVLALGDSRILQIRSFFFEPEVNFYNGGFVTASPADMEYFLRELDVEGVDVLVVNISHFMYNLSYTDVVWPSNNYYTARASGSGVTPLTAAQRILAGIQGGDFSLWQVISQPRLVGLNAKINGNGMLNDGSYYYGGTYAKAMEGETSAQRVSDAVTRVEEGRSRFEYGDEANPNAIYYTEQLLIYCQEKGIKLIGFTSPYAPSVNQAIERHSESYGYMQDMVNQLSALFPQYGAEFYDYTDAAFLGVTDDYFIDGFHPADTVYLRMFIDMIEQGSALDQLCDVNKLQNFDEQAYSPLSLLGSWQEYNELTLKR